MAPRTNAPPPSLPGPPCRSERSFQRAQHWVGELRRNAAGQPLLVLVGNKADLEERAVSREAATELAEANGMLHVETSAKTGAGVAELFALLADRVAAAQQGGG